MGRNSQISNKISTETQIWMNLHGLQLIEHLQHTFPGKIRSIILFKRLSGNIWWIPTEIVSALTPSVANTDAIWVPTLFPRYNYAAEN